MYFFFFHQAQPDDIKKWALELEDSHKVTCPNLNSIK